MEHVLSRVVETGDALTAVWNGGGESSLPYLWLRDNCGCNECRVAQTGEKRFHLFRVARDLRPHRVAIEAGDAGDALAIVWPDGHRTSYRPVDLRRIVSRPHAELSYWDGSFQPRRYEYRQFLDDDAAAAEVIEEFLRSGVCVLVNAPTEPASSEQLAYRLGPLREVVFDRIHDVVVNPGGYSIAHTSLAIAPHSDFTSYDWPPSVQLLHMLVNECEGGESSIVDGFAVLERLRHERPADFDALCAVPVPFRLARADTESYAVNPVVDLDCHGNLRMVRFNTQQMQAVPLWEPRLAEFYAAYHELSTRMNDPRVQAWLRLEGGQILMVSSHRVLHGRTALQTIGHRHLQDAYFEYDNVRNHLVMLHRTGRV